VAIAEIDIKTQKNPKFRGAVRSEAFKALLVTYPQASLARMTGVTRQNVNTWSDVPAKHVQAVMAETGLGLHQIRPDLFTPCRKVGANG
jgi:hypothetical protein